MTIPSSSNATETETMSPVSKDDNRKKGFTSEDWVKIILGVLTLAGIIYPATFAFLQSTAANQAAIATSQAAIAATQTADVPGHATDAKKLASTTDSVTVSFDNPDTNRVQIQLTIKDANNPNGDPIARMIIDPGEKIPINLPSGKYQIETRPIFPALTPTSANCYIQWQPSNSDKADLVITSKDETFQIEQVPLEPQELCLTSTSVTPTPSQ